MAALALAVAFGGGAASVWLALQVPSSGHAGWTPVASAVSPQSSEEFALPLAAGEGASFSATQDERGQPLRADCEYRFAGRLPPAAFWTLVTASGSAATTRGLQSFQVVEGGDGSVVVAVSAHPSPGNWLQIAGPGSFTLTLSLYGSDAADAEGLAGPRLPRIETLRCDE